MALWLTQAFVIKNVSATHDFGTVQESTELRTIRNTDQQKDDGWGWGGVQKIKDQRQCKTKSALVTGSLCTTFTLK
jgi:hypothetical protein